LVSIGVHPHLSAAEKFLEIPRYARDIPSAALGAGFAALRLRSGLGLALLGLG